MIAFNKMSNFLKSSFFIITLSLSFYEIAYSQENIKSDNDFSNAENAEEKRAKMGNR